MVLSRSKEGLCYYKMAQLLLQDRSFITNWENFYYKIVQVLHSQAICISK